MQQTITVNRMPCPTWQRLQVNQTTLPWDDSAPVFRRILRTQEAGLLSVQIKNDPPYATRRYTLHAQPDTQHTVCFFCTPGAPLRFTLSLTLEKNASVRVLQLLAPASNASLVQTLTARCAENARLSLYTVLLGAGSVYTDTHVLLQGDRSAFAAQVGYLYTAAQTLDMNFAVIQSGKQTDCNIEAAGALAGTAQKIFRGTIDFKRGCTDSAASEHETVLLLSDSACSKTVPVLLCAEENVQGSHGATVGTTDEQMLLFFASRGIPRAVALQLLCHAGIKQVLRAAQEDIFTQAVLSALTDAAPPEGEPDAKL